MPYRSVKGSGRSERTVQKSRFFGYAEPCQDEREAQCILERIAMEHPGHSALAYAIVLGAQQSQQRFSDGGEPSGTAGMPILEAIKRRGLTNMTGAVVRYFGGVLLGAGGLTRAFGGTFIDAMENAGQSLWVEAVEYALILPYAAQGKVEHQLQELPYRVESTEFTEMVTIRLTVRQADEQMFLQQARGWTNGQHEPVRGQERMLPWD